MLKSLLRFSCVQLAMKSPDGQKKVCEAVMECLRLACAYSAYIHAYPAMDQAPFSVLLLVLERHEPVRWCSLLAAVRICWEACLCGGHGRVGEVISKVLRHSLAVALRQAMPHEGTAACGSLGACLLHAFIGLVVALSYLGFSCFSCRRRASMRARMA